MIYIYLLFVQIKHFLKISTNFFEEIPQNTKKFKVFISLLLIIVT